MKRASALYQQPQFIYLLVTLFVLLAALYSVVVPPYEAPDEIGHFGYILQLRQTHQLPVQQAGSFGAAQHPPLYYLIATLFSLPGDVTDTTGTYQPNPKFMWQIGGGDDINSAQHRTAETFPYHGQSAVLHLARLASVLMGAGTVFFVFLIGQQIFPNELVFGNLAATLVALNPQFLFISGVINNDNLLTLAATAFLYHLICAVDAHDAQAATKQWGWSGLWLGVATLAKVNGLVLALLAALLLVGTAIQRRSFGYMVRNGLAIGIPVLTLAGWWFVRNWLLYGDLLGWSVYVDVFRVNLRQAPLTSNDLRHFFATQFNSFWGRYGWMNIWSPAWFYLWIRTLIWAALAGLYFFLGRYWRTLAQIQQRALIALVLVILLYEGYILWAITRFNDSWYQGRYIFPILAPLMILMSIGLCSWVAARWQSGVALLLSLIMLAIALYMPLGVIAPAYPMITQPKWRAWLLPHKTTYQFGDAILLRGYTVDHTDDQLILNLYWQALQTPDFNYSAFVHLLDPQGNIVVQDDHAPGEREGYPPQIWQPGDIVIGRYTLPGVNANAVESYQFRVGLYNWSNGQRLAVYIGDTVVGDYVILQ